jgi:hypothetical protein
MIEVNNIAIIRKKNYNCIIEAINTFKNMKASRKIKVKNKVFKKSDIKNIWKKTNDHFQKSLQLKNHTSFNFIINCNDETTYESDEDNFFEEGDLIDNKKINSLSIYYYDYDFHQSLQIDLSHGSNYGNNIIVKGQNMDWVQSTFLELNELLESITPQENFFIKRKVILKFILAIFVGYSIENFITIPFLNLFISPIRNPSYNLLKVRSFFAEHQIFIRFIYAILYYVIGYGPSSIFYHWFLKLWPNIEFDFGPEHHKKEKNRRTRIYILISLYVFPILLSVIFYYLSKNKNIQK